MRKTRTYMNKTELLQYLKDVQDAELDVLTIDGVIEKLKKQQLWSRQILRELFWFFTRQSDGILLPQEGGGFILFDAQALALLIPCLLGLIISITSFSFAPLSSGFTIGMILFVTLAVWREVKRRKRNEALGCMIDEYRKLREEAEDYLELLYSVGIIYEDYRSLIPVSKFRKYIESGLRDRLEGANGAYELYRQEVRDDKFLKKMDDIETAVMEISEKLDIIEQNQYIQIEAAEEIGSRMDSLSYAASRSVAIGEELLKQSEFNQYNMERAQQQEETLARYASQIASNTEQTMRTAEYIKLYTKDTANHTEDIEYRIRQL